MKAKIDLANPDPNPPMIVYNKHEKCYLLVYKERNRTDFSACYLSGEKAGEPYGSVCELFNDKLYFILPAGTKLTLIQES